MNTKFFAVLFFAVAAQAAPAADADADAQLLAAPYAAPYHAAPVVAAVAPNCVTENEILITKSCTPTAKEVCSTEVVETEEIEYENICKDVVDTLCDAGHVAPVVAAPAAHVVYKREAEAEAEADAQFYGAGYAPYAAHAVAHVAPVATAVAHSAVTTVKHACRSVTTKHCVDSPKVKLVPVEVKHCHTVTAVACADVENVIPKTTCEAVETTHVQNYALPYAYGK